MIEWLDRMWRHRRWRKSRAKSRTAAAVGLQGSRAVDDALAATTASRRAEKGATWSLICCVGLVALVFLSKLPLVKSGLWLLVGGIVLFAGSNFVVARAGRSAQKWAAVLWPLMPLALAAWVPGAIVLCIAGGRWVWAILVA
jgi:uncharacterized membrane protein YgdD (TMEM256/DUF423 family)